MSKIKKITVSNLKAVTSLTADFNGCTGIITGGNNKGKSSFLKSLPDRIRDIKPEVVLRHGEKSGSAEMELTTGEKFVWTFDDKKEKLVFVSEKNIPQSVTKDLARVYFPPVFDVDEFLNSTPAKQKATLQKLTGIDFTEFDRAYKNAYEERTFINKRVAEEKARLVLVDPDVIDTPVDTTELEKELNGIEAHNLRYTTVEKGVKEKKEQVTEIDTEIAELQKKIAALLEKKEQVEGDITKGQVWMDEPKNQLKNNKQELIERLNSAKEINATIDANNAAIKQHERFAELLKEQDEAELAVKKLNDEKADIIKNASMPEGFGFDEEGITYKGFAFNKETLSSSGIYIAALKLAAINLGDVKTLHFDASFLDKNSLEEINAWAESENLQLLIERPDFEGGEIEYHIINEQ